MALDDELVSNTSRCVVIFQLRSMLQCFGFPITSVLQINELGTSQRVNEIDP